MDKGYFITFEGIDGSGKSSQLDLVADFLDKKGIKYIKTLEPGDTNLGKKLREILLHEKEKVADNCEFFLYLADRSQHVETIIKKALNENKIVLCDRYTDSTLAYQGYARGIDIKKIKMLNDIATKNLYPDLTLVYDLDVNLASKRVGKEKDRLEKESFEFHNNVRGGYIQIAKNEPKRVKIIDSSKSIEEVYFETQKYVSELLNL